MPHFQTDLSVFPLMIMFPMKLAFQGINPASSVINQSTNPSPFTHIIKNGGNCFPDTADYLMIFDDLL